MAVQLQCPACGGTTQFKTKTSLVTVCEFCNSVLARGDKKVEDLGKVAELLDTQSPLQLDLRGKFQDKEFILVGRAQYRHSAGGVWDEWYAVFRDGTWGWLAEAQGRFFLTFQESFPEGTELPPWEDLQVGGKLTLPKFGPFTITETGTATAIAAAGEMPFRLDPGTPHTYIDLLGPGGKMATLDAEETPPLLFIGKEVTLDEIGVSDKVRAPDKPLKTVSALGLNCPNCGGPLALRAPDQAQRVTCPNCNSLLDITGGKLEYLSTLGEKPFPPVIPLGSIGTFGGVKYELIGFVKRSVTYDLTYYWSEYLLYEPRQGFRWLIESDGHWSFGEPASAGDVELEDKYCRYQGRKFKLFARAVGTVAYVLGEFYWKVAIGEQVLMRDYVAAPETLSLESAQSEEEEGRSASELNCTLAKYIPQTEIKEAFPEVEKWPDPQGVAPNQPFPHKWIYPLWFSFSAALIVLAIVLGLRGSKKVFEKTFKMAPAAQGAEPAPIFADEEIQIDSRRNLLITAKTSLQNSWMHISGQLFRDEDGLLQTFELPVEYYSGTDDGESWSEGSKTATMYLSALPPGKYKLGVAADSEKPQAPESFTLRIDQGAFHWMNFVLAFLFISAIPFCLMLYHWMFENQRWKDSEFKPATSTGGSDDDE